MLVADAWRANTKLSNIVLVAGREGGGKLWPTFILNIFSTCSRHMRLKALQHVNNYLLGTVSRSN